jgi:hypothetical protein
MRLRRILVPAVMTGRELARRGLALGLLTALPLAFYGASADHSDNAITTGGIAMAFSIAGASIFVAMTARPVDQRLILAGYRPWELLVGRLLLLELFGILVAGLFSIVMVFGSSPSDPWLVAGGVGLVSLSSVPFGLAVGEIAPHELEGVLVLIGVVGVQLTLDSSQPISRLLPFWGAARLMDRAGHVVSTIGPAVPVDLLYAVGLFVLAIYIMHRRSPTAIARPVR